MLGKLDYCHERLQCLDRVAERFILSYRMPVRVVGLPDQKANLLNRMRERIRLPERGEYSRIVARISSASPASSAYEMSPFYWEVSPSAASGVS
jgi:hypothetical protein